MPRTEFTPQQHGFHFDTEVLIQLIWTGRRIVEIPVPTFYGDEISRVNGMAYAANCLKAVKLYVQICPRCGTELYLPDPRAVRHPGVRS